MYKKLNITVFSFLPLMLFMACEAWGSTFKTALELSSEEIACCAAACRRAQDLESNGDKKKGTRLGWNDKYSMSIDDSSIESLTFNTEVARSFLGDTRCGGAIFAVKGDRIVIAFSGAKLLGSLDDWETKNKQSVDFSQDVDVGSYSRGTLTRGNSHNGALLLWQGFRDDVLGESGKLKTVLGIQGSERKQAENVQVIVTGHGFGGMVAQLAALDILNTLFGCENKENNVLAVTFGAPRLFDDTAALIWDRAMGGDSHLRIVGEEDGFVRRYSPPSFIASTGTERRLVQKKINVGTYGLLAAKKVLQQDEKVRDFWKHGGPYHTLGKYQEAIAMSAEPKLSRANIQNAWEKFGNGTK